MNMNYVIGSGLSGVACARALLSRGQPVTILDAGLTLEPKNDALRLAKAEVAPEAWSADALAASSTPACGDIPEYKLSHGSDYPYRTPPAAPKLQIDAKGVAASYAQGGLSNVWGAAVLPYREHELAGWPIAMADMDTAYRAVLEFMPLAGQTDALAAGWPLYVNPKADMPVSRQAEALLRRIERHTPLNVQIGRPRLAVNAANCLACGECLNGCPLDLIFSTRQELAALSTAGMEYIPHVVVQGIEEHEDSVRLHTLGEGGESRVFIGARVFVGAGVFGSTGLMLRSLGLARADIIDSQYFILPLLTFARSKNVDRERLHTLAQVFLEIEDETVNPHKVHLQIYGYSNLLDATIAARLGLLKSLRPRVLERMLVVQGYLHSDSSGRLEAHLTGDRVEVVPKRNPETRAALKKVVKRLFGMAATLGAVPISPLLQETVPGRGYHSGGSFPMRASPHAGETDTLGRPFGLQRTHIIDSSVFPTVPAGPITLTVMANAWRIGHEAGGERL